jgi:archaellum component FlaC
MADLTLEKTHALLEKLADYVMSEVPVLKESLSSIKASVEKLEMDVKHVQGNLEHQSGTLNIIRTEQKAISSTLSLQEERIGLLEDKVFGQRVREEDPEYGKDV